MIEPWLEKREPPKHITYGLGTPCCAALSCKFISRINADFMPGCKTSVFTKSQNIKPVILGRLQKYSARRNLKNATKSSSQSENTTTKKLFCRVQIQSQNFAKKRIVSCAQETPPSLGYGTKSSTLRLRNDHDDPFFTPK